MNHADRRRDGHVLMELGFAVSRSGDATATTRVARPPAPDDAAAGVARAV